ncbi:IPT/TIG domain-containing protein [Tenacibaculum piscium]|uniref:IPT/TIG domain-containing protein n=1 Tax=Tenacibaculum piscium TaxID=1458515 RepID=UPI001F475039|nr:IPT/TIG domain-containing protein [Tenacibaculum piscium]
MKKIYSIIILSLIFINCSKENDIEPEPINFPTIEKLSNITASLGEIMTINGENFIQDETYIVKFNMKEGVITEISENYLKVKVPENATSGDITLTFNGKTEIIGEIEILIKNVLYAIKKSLDTSKLITINPTNGEETDILDLSTKDNLESLTFDSKTGIIYAFSNIGDGNETNKIYKLDTKNNNVSNIILNENYELHYEIVTSNNGIIYAIKKSSETSKLITIDPTNGEEKNILDLSTKDNLESLTFDSQTNIIYAFSNIGDGNETNKIYKLNTKDNNVSNMILNENYELHYEIVTSNNGIIYAIKKSSETSKLITIDPTNGEEKNILDLSTKDYLESLTFNSQTDVIYAFSNIGDGNETNKIYKLDTKKNNVSNIMLNENYELRYEIVTSK